MKNRPILPVVYITKYALTKGVFVLNDVERCDDTNEKTIVVRLKEVWQAEYHKPHWHETEAEALAPR